MWIVDDDGDMFNTDHYQSIKFRDDYQNGQIVLYDIDYDEVIFILSKDLIKEERLTRYYNLVEQLTGERIDG